MLAAREPRAHRLDANRVGATLRVDLPTREGGLKYLRKVAGYLAHDAIFAVYTRTYALAERGMSIRDGLLS